MKPPFILYRDYNEFEQDDRESDFLTLAEAVTHPGIDTSDGSTYYVSAITKEGDTTVAELGLTGTWRLTRAGKELGCHLEPHPDRTYIIEIIKGSGIKGEVEAQDAVEAWARFCSNVTIFPKTA